MPCQASSSVSLSQSTVAAVGHHGMKKREHTPMTDLDYPADGTRTGFFTIVLTQLLQSFILGVTTPPPLQNLGIRLGHQLLPDFQNSNGRIDCPYQAVFFCAEALVKLLRRLDVVLQESWTTLLGPSRAPAEIEPDVIRVG